MSDGILKVTLSGSMRFYKEILETAEQMSSQGIVVLAPFKDPRDTLSEADKALHDRIHLEKIVMSDKLFVVNPGGYIGKATQREINFARDIGRPVEYLVPPEKGEEQHA